MHPNLPITPKGLSQLQEEVNLLENEKRPQIVKEIEVARGFGDLSENAEYHSAKERLHQMQRRIRHIKEALMNAHVIDVSSLSGKKIMFGATVGLICQKTKKASQYQIVGNAESDMKNNTISILSALARGLIGKNEGEEAIIKTPSGESIYDITSVQYI